MASGGLTMPDRHGFNELGLTVRCIDCPVGGPLYFWPEKARERHARSHEKARRERAAESRGLLASVLVGEDVAE